MGLSLNPPSARLLHKQPCLHFPLADTYVQGGALLEEPGEKEDDPNGTPDAEPAELTAMGAQDAADAEAVLNQLMRTGANVAPPTGGEEGSSAEFFEEIRKLLADFNVSIQEESKDRKLRFHVKPAHQVPSAAGRGCG